MEGFKPVYASVTTTGSDVTVFTPGDNYVALVPYIRFYNSGTADATVTIKDGTNTVFTGIKVTAGGEKELDFADKPIRFENSFVVNTDQAVDVTILVKEI